MKIRFVRNLNEDSTLLSEIVVPNAVAYIVRANMINAAGNCVHIAKTILQLFRLIVYIIFIKL